MTSPLQQDTPGAMLDMQVIHRSHDGVIVFHRKADGDRFPEVAAIRADGLQQIFPSFVDELTQDSYYTVHGFDEPWKGWKPGRGGVRKAHRAKYLTAAFVDMDCLHPDNGPPVEPVDALHEINLAQERGAIPPYSVICHSGRGLWLFWLLRGEEGDGPIPASGEARAVYENLMGNLGDRLATALPEVAHTIDRNAIDVARLTRIPKSLNTSGMIPCGVAYTIQAGRRGGPFVYTLPELRERFGLPPVETPQRFQPTRTMTTGTAPKRVAGKQARWSNVVNDIEKIATARGGIPQGGRSRATVMYAYHLRRCSEPPEAVMAAAVTFGKTRCNPPMSDSEIRDAVKGARSMTGNGPQYRTVAKWLGITRSDAAALELRAIRPDAVPWKSHKRPRKEAAKIRQRAIREILEGNPGASLRAIRAALAERDISGTIDTVRRDLKHLKRETPEQRRRREIHREQDRQHPLPEPHP